LKKVENIRSEVSNFNEVSAKI